jgi:hypothetical protein
MQARGNLWGCVKGVRVFWDAREAGGSLDTPGASSCIHHFMKNVDGALELSYNNLLGAVFTGCVEWHEGPSRACGLD